MISKVRAASLPCVILEGVLYPRRLDFTKTAHLSSPWSLLASPSLPPSLSPPPPNSLLLRHAVASYP